MAISPQKLLPQSTSGGLRISSSIVKAPGSGLTKRVSTINKGSDFSSSNEKLVPIYEALSNINNILSKRSVENRVENKRKKESEDKKEKKKTEEKLELKGQKKKIDLPKIRTPFASFFDRLKNALVLLFVGWLVNRFFDYIPKILEGVSNFMKTLEDIRKFLKPATDALGTALYNVTLAGTKVLGGITGAQIDQNEKNLAVAINELDKKFSIVNALMAGIIIGDIFSAVADGLDLFERPGRGGPGGVRYQTGRYRNGVRTDQYNGFNRRITRGGTYLVGTGNILEGVRSDRGRGYDVVRGEKDIMRKYFQRFGRDAFVQRFGQEGLEALPRNMQRGFFQRGARNVGAMALRGARNVFGRGAVRVAGKVFGRIPIIGGLIDFVINLAMGEKPGRAAAKAIGATVGAGLGTLIPIPFAGTILGGFLGDLLGGAVYDMFESRNTQRKKGPTKKTEKPKGYFFGGLVSRVGNFFSGRSTKVPKVSTTSGASQKLVKQTPTYSQTIPALKVDPQLSDHISDAVIGGFVGVSGALSQSSPLGPLFALGINLALGQQRFAKGTALSIASGIGNLLGSPLSIAIYNFFDRVMPGLGRLVQKVVGKDFGSFLSNWTTQFLGNEIYKSIYPMIDFIKNLMKVSRDEAKRISEKKTDSPEGSVTPVNVPEGKDEKIKAAIAFYKSKGFSDTGAAYMVGNLLQESGLNPSAVGDNGKAFGLAQWRVDQASGARWLGYKEWAKKNNKQIGDFYAQLEYTIVEGQQYNANLSMMKGNNKSEHRNFIKGYEGYSVEGNRFGFAEDILRNPQKYGLAKRSGGKTIVGPDLKPNNSASLSSMKPSSISAMSYPSVSQFASYDRPSTIVQPIRQVVYVPMGQSSSGGGVVMMGSGGVNNIDYQIAAIKAAL